MKTLAQRSLAAVRKVNKNWKVSICAEPMMELIRCMDMNNSDTTLCREAIRIMELCTSGAIVRKAFYFAYLVDAN